MLSLTYKAFMLSLIMLNFVMLNVVMLNVTMLNVVSPARDKHSSLFFLFVSDE
jgi:hypothetical protein